ncbi:MAG: bifunctional phosphopantothenoylcysteine decarboxylase/phosphopantothenate--cysteine ligase CoaBC [Kiritimatiellae bacterium]|nr:bifunctional phosphopantothenoylcysteine decarboxylase/phosphopantothenate--cysteine ligase CoaBC [Kiritimatiellia bacterium]
MTDRSTPADDHPAGAPRRRPVALCGICGGIAAYKAVDVVSRLAKHGFDVHVAMTEAARKFITPLTFQAVIGRRVTTTLFAPPQADDAEEIYPHLYPTGDADVFVLLPATADMIAKIAQGWGDDVVAASVLALPARCRRFFCPAMNVNMWNQPAVQKDVQTLEAAGWTRIGPGTGKLACGTEGEGRMAEPDEIVTTILLTDFSAAAALQGRRVLILSGPTREHIDPVRYLSNASSGKMGKALAEEALAMGAHVDFVTGPVPPGNMPLGRELAVHSVTGAREMLATSKPLFAKADVIIYAAAVADYEPAQPSEAKLPKSTGDFALPLKATPDIAATLCANKRRGQVAIGFALQEPGTQRQAAEKLKVKHLDGIVLNSPAALGADRGTYSYLSAADKDFADWGELPKRICAQRILREAAKMLD